MLMLITQCRYRNDSSFPMRMQSNSILLMRTLQMNKPLEQESTDSMDTQMLMARIFTQMALGTALQQAIHV